MATKKKLLQAAAGNAGGAGLNVEDVFSTYLYTGGTAQEINNGIDLDTEGGMVWIKRRETSGYDHQVFDTERTSGTYSTPLRLSPNLTNPEDVYFTTGEFSWLTDGFDLNNADANVNGSGGDYASWTFRKAPKFFTCLTYTGDGTVGRNISHNLGSKPGCVIVKKTSGSEGWFVSHRGYNNGANTGYLNMTNAFTAGTSTEIPVYYATDTTFRVSNISGQSYANTNGATYVAYLFAHNDGDGEFGPDADADIIKCGSYTGTGSTNGPEIDLGFEPQWVMVKRADAGSEHWAIIDNMREMISLESGNARMLKPNNSEAEEGVGFANPLATGFKVNRDEGVTNASGGTYIYIAIRRGTAVPESATDVFAVTTQSGSTPPAHDTGFVTDFSLRRENALSSASVIQAADRLRGKPYLTTEGTNSETNLNNNTWDFMDGWFGATSNDSNKYAWSWKRAPKYFDVVAYTGNGAATQDINHNLGVAPEMIWVKNRDSGSAQWPVWHVGNPNYSTYLNQNLGSFQTGGLPYYVGQNVTDTTFRVSTDGSSGQSNASGNNYIAYLFATLAGISKVGSVTHSGTTNVDCGFSSGARFVLLKRTDATGDWYVWDSVRGIVSGNDPYLLLNTTAAEVTNTDYIDPLSSGFTITSSFTAGDYIFYAIA